MPWRPGYADEPPQENGRGYQFFTAAEAAFIEAATARLIPTDENGPGAIEAGVPYFIDRQLAGPYGHGDRFYMGGPWPKGLPTQGYQSRFTPAELYRAGIRGTEGYVGQNFGGKAFKALAVADQEKILHALESGEAQLQGVEAKTFFTMFLQNTIEGYFSDPIYGGNRDLGPWRMIGFPGAHYDYREWVPRHGQRFPLPPVGIRGRPGWEA
jgi:gluconate 2-dehydrogenase gamma chain